MNLSRMSAVIFFQSQVFACSQIVKVARKRSILAI